MYRNDRLCKRHIIQSLFEFWQGRSHQIRVECAADRQLLEASQIKILCVFFQKVQSL